MRNSGQPAAQFGSPLGYSPGFCRSFTGLLDGLLCVVFGQLGTGLGAGGTVGHGVQPGRDHGRVLLGFDTACALLVQFGTQALDLLRLVSLALCMPFDAQAQGCQLDSRSLGGLLLALDSLGQTGYFGSMLTPHALDGRGTLGGGCGFLVSLAGQRPDRLGQFVTLDLQNLTSTGQLAGFGLHPNELAFHLGTGTGGGLLDLGGNRGGQACRQIRRRCGGLRPSFAPSNEVTMHSVWTAGAQPLAHGADGGLLAVADQTISSGGDLLKGDSVSGHFVSF
jgi:hypothetical protein